MTEKKRNQMFEFFAEEMMHRPLLTHEKEMIKLISEKKTPMTLTMPRLTGRRVMRRYKHEGNGSKSHSI